MNIFGRRFYFDRGMLQWEPLLATTTQSYSYTGTGGYIVGGAADVVYSPVSFGMSQACRVPTLMLRPIVLKPYRYNYDS